MGLTHHFELLAAYNQSMNLKVYAAAGRLNETDLMKDRGAFFGSIVGTLNHIVVADTIWLKRFASHPSCSVSLREVAGIPNPTALDQMIFDDFASLTEHRYWLDRQIVDWTGALTECDLDSVISYSRLKGAAVNKRFSYLILHFFNHQTHHRGQVSTLLSQAGGDVGVTDLLPLIPEETHE